MLTRRLIWRILWLAPSLLASGPAATAESAMETPLGGAPELERFSTIQEILHNDLARAEFKKYLDRHHASESLAFWQDTEHFKSLPSP